MANIITGIRIVLSVALLFCPALSPMFYELYIAAGFSDTKHLKTIFNDGEIEENSTCANYAQVADNGKTYRLEFGTRSMLKQ
jgi:hypothetical protein